MKRKLRTAIVFACICAVASIDSLHRVPSRRVGSLSEPTHDLQNVCLPRYTHLSLGRNQNSTHSSMTVSFSVSPECLRYADGSVAAAVSVWKDNFNVLVLGTKTMSYNATFLDSHLNQTVRDGNTHYVSDHHYHIEINGLKPSTKYYYKCLLLCQADVVVANDKHLRSSSVGRNTISQSDDSTFLTSPAPGHWHPPPLDRTVRFAVLGDLSVKPHARETVRALDNHHQDIDCILIAGDLSYANSDHRIWDDWMNMMSKQEFFRTIPLKIALGNHDLDYDPHSLEISLAYESRFRMPQIRPAVREFTGNELFHHGTTQAKAFVPYEYGNAYYSFTFGPSKHIVLSSYSSFVPDSIQYQWLVSELEATDRSVTPWLIVMIHCPIYTTFKNHHDEIFTTKARTHLEPLFADHSVNFVIAGHVHSYMRTRPTINSTFDPRGPIYIIQGNGGRQVNEPYLNKTPEEWVAVRDHSMYGYGTLELFNQTHAKWSFVKTGFNTNVSEQFAPDFNIHDDAWIMNQLGHKE